MRMRKVPITAVIFMGCLALACAASIAKRPVRLWSSEDLVKEADVVVIATVQSSTHDAKNHKYTNPKSETWVDVDTDFAVQATLKGKNVEKRLTLRHKRYYSPTANISVVDGPAFVTFSSKTKTAFLLFLKQDAEGVYEPVTGQYDPDQSFNRLLPARP
jgi:hypothetical protein